MGQANDLFVLVHVAQDPPVKFSLDTLLCEALEKAFRSSSFSFEDLNRKTKTQRVTFCDFENRFYHRLRSDAMSRQDRAGCISVEVRKLQRLSLEVCRE